MSRAGLRAAGGDPCQLFDPMFSVDLSFAASIEALAKAFLGAEAIARAATVFMRGVTPHRSERCHRVMHFLPHDAKTLAPLSERLASRIGEIAVLRPSKM
jgi:hypothetical protein